MLAPSIEDLERAKWSNQKKTTTTTTTTKKNQKQKLTNQPNKQKNPKTTTTTNKISKQTVELEGRSGIRCSSFIYHLLLVEKCRRNQNEDGHKDLAMMTIKPSFI